MKKTALTLMALAVSAASHAMLPDVAGSAVTPSATQTKTSVTITIQDDALWSTVVLPFSADIPDGMLAYAVCSTSSHMYDEDGDGTAETERTFLVLRQQASLKAFTPYIMHADYGMKQTVSGYVDSSQIPSSGIVSDGEGYLKGALTEQEITEGYVLQTLTYGTKFYKITQPTNWWEPEVVFTIPQYKCWLDLSSVSSTASFCGFEYEGQTTDIFQMENVKWKMENNAGASRKSIIKYIKDGRLVIEKDGKHYTLDGTIFE